MKGYSSRRLCKAGICHLGSMAILGLCLGSETSNEVNVAHLAAVQEFSAMSRTIENGAEVNERGDGGLTAIHWASYHGRREVVEYLITKNAKCDVEDNSGWTPLMFAAKRNDTEIAQALLAAGAQWQSRNRAGWTAIMIAGYHKHEDMVRKLLRYGANPEIEKTTQLRKLLGEICRGKRANLPYPGFVESSTQKSLNCLLALCASVDFGDCEGNTPLIYASNASSVSATKLLIDRKAAVDVANQFGETPLMYAARNGALEIVELLIENGSKVNTQDSFNKESALHNACAKRQTDVVRYLIKKGADPNLKNRAGYTSLAYAASHGELLIAEILLQHGANPKLKTNNGETPLSLARRWGHEPLVKLLSPRQ